MKILVLLALVLSAVPSLADEMHSDHQHAVLGEIGKAPFPSTYTRAAQQEIDRGVALIHSFWYAEAEKAFRKAAEADEMWHGLVGRCHEQLPSAVGSAHTPGAGHR